MTFDTGTSKNLYNILHAQVADGEVDHELLLDALDQLQYGWERVAQLETRVAELENMVHAVGAR